ncbi:protein of unknown function [Aminobacter niigataensis]|nr:protein of unknown function [Aminobacter niigataensis]
MRQWYDQIVPDSRTAAGFALAGNIGALTQDAQTSSQTTEVMGLKGSASWPVSRVLYGPRALRHGNVATILLGRMLPCASRNLPGR